MLPHGHFWNRGVITPGPVPSGQAVRPPSSMYRARPLTLT
jgi:hypothetical protein